MHQPGSRMQQDAPPALGARLAMDVVESRVHERLFGAAGHTVTIGRFTVLGPAGAGGMGVVFAARDPQLDRRVAIKLVALAPAESSASSQARLLAEAQTMARLSHPNIVAVHEVGTYEGRIYIAMEYIEGETLERWLTRGESPGLSAILDAFVQAGQGLAAAHRAGVVHRDFKPSNAMIDGGGRVRVLDFGLAIDDELERTDDDESAAERSSSMLGGTPLYMAPEQRLGGGASARSDQYSLCVSLWRALYGEHPFVGDRHDRGGTSVAAKLARVASVPVWLRRVLERGLEAEPARRWPNMESLLDALTRGRLRARRRRVLVGATALVLAGVGVVGLHALDLHRRQLACAQQGEQLAAAWDEHARTEVVATMRATEVGYVEATLDKVLSRLDAQRASLQHAGSEACLAATVDGRWDTETLARSQWCLDLRQLELEALVGELMHADRRGVQNAVVVASKLSDAQACLDTELLSRLPQPPAEQREDIHAVRAELVHAAAHEDAGRYAEGLAEVTASLERAAAIDWPPLSASLKTEQAVLLERQGSYEPARRAGEAGYLEAARAGAWDVAATAASELVMIVGLRMSQPTAGLLWAEHAAVAEAHAGDPQQLMEARRLERVANVLDEAGDYAPAQVAGERALALAQAALGPDHPTTASYLVQLANLALARGELDASRSLYERAIAMQVEALGPEHPAIGDTLQNLGNTYIKSGEFALARTIFQQALELLQRSGESNPSVAHALIHLAQVDTELGDLPRARVELERARPIVEAAYGVSHPTYALVLSELGNVHYQAGENALAGPLYEQSLAIEEKTLGPQHINVAVSLTSLGNVMVRTGELERAAVLLGRALAISETALGPEHPTTGVMVRNLAGVYCASGDHAHAIPLVERAVAILEKQEGDQQGEPGAHALLAKLLIDTDRARALAEAEKALRGYRGTGDEDSQRDVEELIASASRPKSKPRRR
jgi:eukaryotic-like serine/threonine-protein kinase